MSHNTTTKNIIEQRSDITIIPINTTTMITTTPSIDPEKRREDTLCKFIREYIYKVAQIVIAARRVSPHCTGFASKSPYNYGVNNMNTNNNTNNSLSESWNDLNAPYSQWFRIEMTDSLQIQRYIEDECIANWNAKHSDFTLTIDISLSAEPLSEHVLLERWKIKFKREHFDNYNHNKFTNDPSLIYKRMTIQIRSILSYLRLLPTHSIVQSWEQYMAQQSMLMNINNTKNIYGSDQNINMIPDRTPFALYHLIYSHHNRDNDNISNFAGTSKSFCFEGLRTKFGTIRTTVFYGANIRKEFEWLIRSVPGKNPPIFNDNLGQYIDSSSRYWDKKEEYKYDKYVNHNRNDGGSNGDISEDEELTHSTSKSNNKSDNNHRKSSLSSSDKKQLHKTRKHKNRLTDHYNKGRNNSPYRGPVTVHKNNNNNSPNFELIRRSPEQHGINPTAFLLDDQMGAMINIKPSPPIKCLASNPPNFHESPVLDTSTPKLDPQKEMEKIRLSTIFGSAPPVISLADVSTVKDQRDHHNMMNMNGYNNGYNQQYGTGSQLLDSIVKEKQIISTRKHNKITIMKTLMDENENENDNANKTENDIIPRTGDIFGDVAKHLDQSIDSSDMNCDESDHDDIQDEIFEGYDDETNNEQKHIAQITEFINLCNNANKLQLISFKTKDALLINEEIIKNKNDDDSKKYFNLLSKHFEIRQQRLIQLKKTSSIVLSNSIIKKQ